MFARRLVAVWALTMGLLSPMLLVPVPVQADSVTSVTIEDIGLMTFITSNPAVLSVGTDYAIRAEANGANHPTRLEIDLGASKTTYWTVHSQGFIGHHGSGSTTCSWISNKYSCTSTGGDYLTEVYIQATSAAPVSNVIFTARAASPTGLDQRPYSSS